MIYAVVIFSLSFILSSIEVYQEKGFDCTLIITNLITHAVIGYAILYSPILLLFIGLITIIGIQLEAGD